MRLVLIILLLVCSWIEAKPLARVGPVEMTEHDLSQLRYWQQWLNHQVIEDETLIQIWVIQTIQRQACEDLNINWPDEWFMDVYHPNHSLLTEKRIKQLTQSTDMQWPWLKAWLLDAARVNYVHHYYFKLDLEVNLDEMERFLKQWNQNRDEYHLWLIKAQAEEHSGLQHWAQSPSLWAVPPGVQAEDQGWLPAKRFPESIQHELKDNRYVTPIYQHKDWYWLLYVADRRQAKLSTMDEIKEKFIRQKIEQRYNTWRNDAIQSADYEIYHG